MKDRVYDQETLKKLQAVELEILHVVHDFCVKNDIKYSLAYGTLIGAVRHKGFIPWDDDVDLMMTRQDYNRFIEMWKKHPVSGYDLVENDIQSDYPNNFLKIRKEGTAFVQTERELEGCSYSLGIFLDIFPFDKVAPLGIQRKKQYYACLINMLLTRDYSSGAAGIKGIIECLLLKIPNRCKRWLKQKTKKYIEKWNGTDTTAPLINYCTFEYASKYFPDDMFDEYTEIEFGGTKFFAVTKYDEVLKESFGDYMILPPANERKTHYPLFLDFDNEYFKNREK